MIESPAAPGSISNSIGSPQYGHQTSKLSISVTGQIEQGHSAIDDETRAAVQAMPFVPPI
jgi:hypothetical protein